ncbi:MAG: serine/threonine-protein phosphatase [Mogibacterium sp.]|nr:serine/threonine-protein phosphatase [Mogibacterium sp.]
MNYLTASYTDIGIRKKTNQDSMIILKAESSCRKIVFASVCDGMGGLAKGELASATMCRSLEAWLIERFPILLAKGFSPDDIWDEWEKLIEFTNRAISNYATDNRTSLGTTCTALLLLDNIFYLMNVGDSRIYRLSDNIYQITKDQTVVQREIDAGRMTYEEAMTHPERSVLLQCIGASADVHPDYISGVANPGDVFLLCSDGFRHVVSAEEFYQAFNPQMMISTDIMEQKLQEITEINKQRMEDDNISALLIKLA